MTLYNDGPDQSGVIGLGQKREVSPVDPQDASMPFADRSEKATKASFDSLRSVVSGAGAAWVVVQPLAAGDDGANISTILKTKNVVLVPGATYHLATGIIPVSDRTLDVSNAILKGSMAQSGGSANSLIVSQRTLLGVSTTVADAPGTPFGQNVMHLASAAGIPIGSQIEVAIAAGLQAVKTYFRVDAYNGPNVAAFDGPVLYPFVTGDPVRLVSRLQNFTLIAHGAVFTGSGDYAISISAADKLWIEGNFTVDCSQPVAGVTLAGGVEIYACTRPHLEGVYVDGNNAGNDQFGYGVRIASCVDAYTCDVSANGCTIANVLHFDNVNCIFVDTDVADSATNLASGISIGGTAAANPNGCVNCDYYSIDAANFFNGWGMNIDRAVDCCFFGYHGEFAALLQFGFTVAQDLFFYGVTVHHSAQLAATGFGQGFVVGPSATGCEMDSVALVDCGSTVGGTPNIAEIQSGSIVVRNYKQRNPTVASTRGLVVAFTTTAGIVVRLQDVDIETCPAGGGMTGGALRFVGNAAGETAKLFLERATITVNSANDVAIAHVTAGIMQLTDVAARNPNGVGATSGYVGGAGTTLRREGRVDFSATATPITANQSNVGSFVTNGATPVPVAFADINAQTLVDVWMLTAAGTPAPDQTIANVAGTGFNFTGKAADASTRAYAIHGG